MLKKIKCGYTPKPECERIDYEVGQDLLCEKVRVFDSLSEILNTDRYVGLLPDEHRTSYPPFDVKFDGASDGADHFIY